MAISCDGEMTQAVDGAPLCSGDWVVEPPQLEQLYELLNSAFSTPDAVSIGAAFMAGCSIPLIAFLVAWGYQSVISFVNQKED